MPRRKVAVAFLAACLSLGTIMAVARAPKTLDATCTRVLDGDTLECQDAQKNTYRVRFLKNDAPEIVHTKDDSPSSKDQPHGRDAFRFVESKVLGKPIKVAYRRKDSFHRLLGTVYVGDEELNLTMVRAGLSWYPAQYDKPPDAVYQAAMDAARKGKIGLWADANPIDPAQWRKDH